MRRAAVFALLAGLLAGLASAQPPATKTKDKKDTPPPAAPLAKLPDVASIKAEEKSFQSVDGVKLRGLFYTGTKGGNGPVVILLHEYKKDPNESRWDGTAKLLAASGFNAFRFAFRGHGELRNLHSLDIAPDEFFLNPMNRALVNAQNPAAKTTIKADKDFRNGYHPMLVQDLAAVRTLLDQMNDAGECNTSSVYLLGAGDAVNLGFLFLAAEWRRERERVKNVFGGAAPAITSNRPPQGDVGPAGLDYAGAVWLGPTTTSGFPVETMKLWVNEVIGPRLRSDTPMLFLHGGADAKGKQGANTFFDNIMRAGAKAGANGGKVPEAKQYFKRELPKLKNAGASLLGTNLGTEQVVLEFLAEVEKERKNKPRKQRDFEKPLYIDVRSFGVGGS